MPAIPQRVVCLVRLLLELQKIMGPEPDEFVFRGLNGHLVAKILDKTQPLDTPINYMQYLRYLSLWFSGVLGSTPEEFRKQICTQSSRNGGASAASNAGISLELWGQYGDYKSFAPHKCFMERDMESILSVSTELLWEMARCELYVFRSRERRLIFRLITVISLRSWKETPIVTTTF